MNKRLKSAIGILFLGVSSLAYSQEFGDFQKNFNQFLEPHAELKKDFDACAKPLKDYDKNMPSIGFSKEIGVFNEFVPKENRKEVKINIMADNIEIVKSANSKDGYYEKVVSAFKLNGLQPIFESKEAIPSRNCINCTNQVIIFKKPGMNFQEENQKLRQHLTTVDKLNHVAYTCLNEAVDKFKVTILSQSQERDKMLDDLDKEFTALFPDKAPIVFKNMISMPKTVTYRDAFGEFKPEDLIDKKIADYTPEKKEQIKTLFRTIMETIAPIAPRASDFDSVKRDFHINRFDWQRYQYHKIEAFVGRDIE